jgi:hypothetical protein
MHRVVFRGWLMIAFTCMGCGSTFQADESLAGRRSRCKRCGAVTRIPSPEPPPAPAALAPVPSPSVGPGPTPTPEAPARRAVRQNRKPKKIDRDAWVSLVIGAGLAAVALAVPLVGFVIDVLRTVIHELGHTASAWLLGSPALPSFDLTFGGGVSDILDRQPLVIVAIYAAFAWLVFRARDDRTTLAVMLITVALYSVAVFTPIRGLLITAMGHGTELIIAGVFLYRALSGSQILRSQERPLYAFLGLYLILADAWFAYNLITSPEHRAAYEEAKGGGHRMDFSLIAEEYLHVRLGVVAASFLLACTAPIVAAFLFHRYGRHRK